VHFFSTIQSHLAYPHPLIRRYIYTFNNNYAVTLHVHIYLCILFCIRAPSPGYAVAVLAHHFIASNRNETSSPHLSSPKPRFAFARIYIHICINRDVGTWDWRGGGGSVVHPPIHKEKKTRFNLLPSGFLDWADGVDVDCNCASNSWWWWLQEVRGSRGRQSPNCSWLCKIDWLPKSPPCYYAGTIGMHGKGLRPTLALTTTRNSVATQKLHTGRTHVEPSLHTYNTNTHKHTHKRERHWKGVWELSCCRNLLHRVTARSQSAREA
jgi:hypothetical protein